MNKWLIILFMVIVTNLSAQNEYAATAFYNALKEIYDDAQSGFILTKGTKKPESTVTFTDEYFLKTLLPLADSGKIVWPLHGNPYAVYYMESSKKMEYAQKRAGNLREAIESVFKRDLIVRTESVLNGSNYFTDSYFYTDQAETRKYLALFRISVFFDNNRYTLLFEVRGRLPD